MIKKKVINSKDVYITEDHHNVLLPWTEFRLKSKFAPTLFTLDHHEDCVKPFRSYSHDPNNFTFDNNEAKKELDKIRITEKQTIVDAISKLAHDEHIITAIQKDIIDKAIIFQYDNINEYPVSYEITKYNSIPWQLRSRDNISVPNRPYTYPTSNIYIPENTYVVGEEEFGITDENIKKWHNQCIESIFINDKLSILNEMNSKLVHNEVLSAPYILDIDLDYFHTRESINPTNSDSFYHLIKKSELITIATEPSLIKEWSEVEKFDIDLTWEYLLENLLNHIKKATN